MQTEDGAEIRGLGDRDVSIDRDHFKISFFCNNSADDSGSSLSEGNNPPQAESPFVPGSQKRSVDGDVSKAQAKHESEAERISISISTHCLL